MAPKAFRDHSARSPVVCAYELPEDGRVESQAEGLRTGHLTYEEPHPLDALCENSAMSKDETSGNNLDREQLDVVDDVKGKRNAPNDTRPKEWETQSATSSVRSGADDFSPKPPYNHRAQLSRRRQPSPKRFVTVLRHRAVGATERSERLSTRSPKKPLHAYATADDEISDPLSRQSSDSHLSTRLYDNDVGENRAPQFNEIQIASDYDTDHGALMLAQRSPRSHRTEDLLEELDLLRRENERLRAGPRAATPPPAVPTYAHKTFYCIDKTFYLDEPRWEPGDRCPILRSSNPLSRNTDHYLEQHPEVAFAYYKYYNPTAPVNREKIEAKDGVFRTPIPFQQSLSFIAPQMLEAVENLVREVPDFGEYFPYFDPMDYVDAPYLFMYYSMPFMTDILPCLDPLSRNLLQQLQKTIDESHGWEYASAKAKARKGLVSRHLLKYLIRPGDVLVDMQGLGTQAYVALEWAEEQAPDIDGDPEDYEDYDTTRRRKKPKRGSKSQTKDAQKRLRYKWKVPVSSWKYDGCFEMHETFVYIMMKVAYEDEEVVIDDLNIFPLEYAPPDLRATLERRGRMFWKLRHGKLVSYQQDEEGGLSNVDERYMVDIETYKQLHPRSRVSMNRLRADLDAKDMANLEPPGGNLLLLFPPQVPGYNLLRKKWVDLYVDRLSEITWNKQAFKDLVVDEETKVLVQALVTNQLVAEKSTDSISGKGNGLVILLHGAPGTGKTFTAEGVAEFAEKPLFRVTCGDVGTGAEIVEKRLQSSFHLGKIWDCVVLLDEADVFLEERDMKDLNRNALVSVFLRALEYYDGILILTSNRVGTFDEAFKSRIQLALHYENLTTSQRRKIWRNFVNRLRTFEEPNVDFDDITDHIDDLSKEDMNGREIRNAITTARQLAQFQGTPFCYSHLKLVIGVSGKFGKYLKDLRDGLTDDELKRDSGLRLSYKADASRDRE